MTILHQNQDAIKDLCFQHKVKNLFVFGSILTERFNSQSDIDFVVEFDDMDVLDYADNYFDLKFSLEDLLNHKVDLLEAKALRNQNLKQHLDYTKALVYAG